MDWLDVGLDIEVSEYECKILDCVAVLKGSDWEVLILL